MSTETLEKTAAPAGSARPPRIDIAVWPKPAWKLIQT